MWHTQLAPFARRQHGLVTHTQAVEVVSPAHVRFLLRTGRIERVRRGVYRIAGVPESWYQHLLAACLVRPGAYASFRSAATLWHLEGFDDDILEITVPGSSRARLDGVVVHESRVNPPGHRVTRLRIPVASVARTLCDLTAVADARTVERAVDDALRRKLVTLTSLRNAADTLHGQGRLRCTVTRRILEARLPGFDPGGSPAELRIVRLLVRAGLPKPVQQWRVRHRGRTARADLAYPELGIVMEYDGWDYHAPRSNFDGDRDRGNVLELLELTVLRFTSASTDAYIVETVTEAYERALAKRATNSAPSIHQ
jgi:very-short-patch-repair endonuclease